METRRLAAAQDFAWLSQSKIARKYGVSRTTASRWARALASGKDLHKRRATGRPCFLTPDKLKALKRAFKRTPVTGRELADYIEHKFGVHYHEDHAGRLIHRLGLSPRGHNSPMSVRAFQQAEEQLAAMEETAQ